MDSSLLADELQTAVCVQLLDVSHSLVGLLAVDHNSIFSVDNDHVQHFNRVIVAYL